MKKVLKGLAVSLLAAVTFTNVAGVRAAEEIPTTDESVQGLFDKYYSEGIYEKHTSINMTEDAVLESIQYFHAKSTVLNRTTYYADDALWMSRGNGSYSYYGTAYDELMV